jgi:hypothetical protein
VSIGYEEVLLSQEELEWTAGEDEKLIAAVVKTVHPWWDMVAQLEPMATTKSMASGLMSKACELDG